MEKWTTFSGNETVNEHKKEPSGKMNIFA